MDSDLEDRFGDEVKNKLLSERAENFLKENKDYLGRLYELKGIITGFVCDDEVNELEIDRLNGFLKYCYDDLDNI